MVLHDPLMPCTIWVNYMSETLWELPLPKVCLYLQTSNCCLYASFTAAQHKNFRPCLPRGRSVTLWKYCGVVCLCTVPGQLLNVGIGDPQVFQGRGGTLPLKRTLWVESHWLLRAHSVVNTEHTSHRDDALSYGQPETRRDSFTAFLLPGKAGSNLQGEYSSGFRHLTSKAVSMIGK